MLINASSRKANENKEKKRNVFLGYPYLLSSIIDA
jgi:hypothetical protein